MNNEEKILAILAAMQSEMGAMRSDIAGLKATQASQSEQLNRLEEKVDELDERSLRTAVLLESEIAPKVQLLLDGHSHLVDTLAPKERVEKVERTVEEKVVVLESVVTSHSKRIAALEKAQ